jgi:hypothetical protein
MKDLLWFGARTVYQVGESYANDSDMKNLYEERVVLIRGNSFEDAISNAEKEAEAYATEVGMTYLNFVKVFKLGEKNIEDGIEVYSLMRASKLEANEYLDRFFDTGSEMTS